MVALTAMIQFSSQAELRADTVVKVDPGSAVGAWEGWGCALAWWANQYGDRMDLADVIFTRKATVLTTSTGSYALPGLGLNIARYNVGGNSNVALPDGRRDVVPPSLRPATTIEGYALAPSDTNPASFDFDWSVDRNQRTMLVAAKDRDADIFELFSNSPMWWMNKNDSTAGSADGADNLRPDEYPRFAAYLAGVAKYAKEHWGIEFRQVEPFNEPSASWWKYPSGQECCHFDVASQIAMIPYLRAALDHRGLKNIGIAASDENNPDTALSTWNALPQTVKDDIAQVNCHAYMGQGAYRGPNMATLYRSVAPAKKRLWMSEYGDNDSSGLTLAETIVFDINQLHPSAWVYWQPLDDYGWGLIDSSIRSGEIGAPATKYFVYAQFTRTIRPGMTLLTSNDPNTILGYDAERRVLGIVTVNPGGSRSIAYDLSMFRMVDPRVKRWVTKTEGGAAGGRYAEDDNVALDESAMQVEFDAKSVQSLIVTGVSPRAGSPER
jgi:galactan endo-1,6-beta-galactosidase